MKVWRSAKNPNSYGKKPQTINNRWLDSKVDNTQLSPLYSCFKRNCHLHCNALESNFCHNISYSTILLGFNSVALVCCIINSQAIWFCCRIQTCKTDISDMFSAVLVWRHNWWVPSSTIHIHFLKRKYGEQLPHKCSLRWSWTAEICPKHAVQVANIDATGDSYIREHGRTAARHTTWCVLGKSSPSQLTSHRRSWDRHSPLQGSQLLSFLASDGTMLYEDCIFICKDWSYLNHYISINTSYWEK